MGSEGKECNWHPFPPFNETKGQITSQSEDWWNIFDDSFKTSRTQKWSKNELEITGAAVHTQFIH